MEAQIWSFLLGVGLDELVQRGVLEPQRTMGHLLRAGSVEPLLALMRERNVELLQGENMWSLKVNGDFVNRTSPSLKDGNLAQLSQPGNLFTGKNRYLNPFFNRETGEAGDAE